MFADVRLFKFGDKDNPVYFRVGRQELLYGSQRLISTLDWANMTTLLLTAEVLSPSSLRADRFAKRTLYQRAGVALYWIVDADARSVEVWTPDARFPATERDVLRWSPAGATRDFELTLNDLFAPI